MAVDKGFLENLQGLTTLKIYPADEKKAREMESGIPAVPSDHDEGAYHAA